MDYEPGVRLHVALVDGREFQGVVVPSQQGLVLKLADGYNIGIAAKNVKETKQLSAKQSSSKSAASVKKDSSLAHVDILHTGGTIASKVDYETGGVSNLFSPDELLAMYPQLQETAQVHAQFIANMSSDDMRFAHYNQLVRAVKRVIEENNPVGVVITHGTDTLHYTAAALHYALQGVPVPVVLVGSQRSSDRGSSDAATNLQAAITYCTSPQAASGVFIAMHDTSSDSSVGIFPGVHARKMHTSRRDAFKAVNSRLVARVCEGSVEEVSSARVVDKPFSVQEFDEDLRIGLLYVHPQMFADELSAYSSFDALIILGTGLGHLPISDTDEATSEHKRIAAAVTELASSVPVVMASQCVHGRVSLQVYSPARRLQEMGVLGHGLALTGEALFAKVAFLLSAGKEASLVGEDFGDLVARTQEVSYE